MEPMDQFSHRILPKIQHCMCMTKICVVYCHCHLKKKSLHEIMYLAIDSHQPKRFLHQLKTIQTICASVHMVHHVHHMECSMYRLVNTVNIRGTFQLSIKMSIDCIELDIKKISFICRFSFRFTNFA